MPRFVAPLVSLVVLAGCGVGERPFLIEDGTAFVAPEMTDASRAEEMVNTDGAASAETNPAVESDTSLPDPGDLGDAPPMLISPTGVLVPVLARTDTGYRVLTPCGNNADLVFGQPVWGADVVLDPGHGGDEPGALGPDGETEAELNLDIARRTAALIEAEGFTVALTRTSDYRIPIPNRTAIADQLDAFAFVSIHHNSPSSNPSETPGTEVYVQAGDTESSRLGGLVYEEVLAALSVYDVTWSSRADAGVLTVLNDSGENAYGIIRYPSVPVALAELAYLSNPAEALVLATPEYRQAAAGALATAIIRFLDTEDPGSGFIETPRLFNPSGSTGGAEGCVDPPLS